MSCRGGEGLGDVGAVTNPSLRASAEEATDGERLREALCTHQAVVEDGSILKHQLRLPAILNIRDIDMQHEIAASEDRKRG